MTILLFEKQTNFYTMIFTFLFNRLDIETLVQEALAYTRHRDEYDEVIENHREGNRYRFLLQLEQWYNLALFAFTQSFSGQFLSCDFGSCRWLLQGVVQREGDDKHWIWVSDMFVEYEHEHISRKGISTKHPVTL